MESFGSKNIINKKNITDFKKKDLILDQLEEESLNQSVILIKNNLSLLGVNHDTFVYESH